MLRQIATLVILAALPALATASESEDVCVQRPDLCSDHVEAPRPVKKAPAATSGARCRAPYQAYPLEHADWPLCQKPNPAAATPAAARAPSSSEPAVTFESYMATNARHPALAGKIPDHQRAFVDTKRTAVIDFPRDGVSTKENDSPLGTNPPQAGNPQQGVTTLPSNVGGAGGFTLPAGFDPKNLPANLPANLPTLFQQPQTPR